MKLRKELLEEMFEQAREAFPDEACGILGGRDGVASVLYKTENDDASPVSYAIGSRDLFKVMKELRARDLDMVAIYHSHVSTEAYPSDTDIRLAFYPDACYLIISLEDFDHPYAKAFRIVDDKITEAPLDII